MQREEQAMQRRRGGSCRRVGALMSGADTRESGARVRVDTGWRWLPELRDNCETHKFFTFLWFGQRRHGDGASVHCSD